MWPKRTYRRWPLQSQTKSGLYCIWTHTCLVLHSPCKNTVPAGSDAMTTRTQVVEQVQLQQQDHKHCTCSDCGKVHVHVLYADDKQVLLHRIYTKLELKFSDNMDKTWNKAAPHQSFYFKPTWLLLCLMFFLCIIYTIRYILGSIYTNTQKLVPPKTKNNKTISLRLFTSVHWSVLKVLEQLLYLVRGAFRFYGSARLFVKAAGIWEGERVTIMTVPASFLVLTSTRR